MQIPRNVFALSKMLQQSCLNAVFPLGSVTCWRLGSQGLENDLALLLDWINRHFLADSIEPFEFDDAGLGRHDVVFDGWKQIDLSIIVVVEIFAVIGQRSLYRRNL